jgi:hypothetical protein
MIAETVFQQMEMTLDTIALLLVVILIIAAVGVARLGKLLKLEREAKEKRAEMVVALPTANRLQEPLPPPLKLTAKDLEETDAITARRALETERLFKPKPTP